MHKKETPTLLISPEKTPCTPIEQEQHLLAIFTSSDPFLTLSQTIKDHIPERVNYSTDIDLYRQIQSNPDDPQPRQELLWRHLPTIRTVLSDYRHLSYSDQDLVESGVTIALDAINSWTPVTNPKQSQQQDYLAFQIHQKIDQGIQTAILHHYGLGTPFFPAVKLYLETATEFEKQFGRRPKPSDLPEIKAIIDEKIQNLPESNRPRLFFKKHHPSNKDTRKGLWRGDIIRQVHDIYTQAPLDQATNSDSTQSEYNARALKQSLSFTTQSLSAREQEVIYYRYTRDKTLEQTAQDLGTTIERIRQVEAKALRKLRHPARSKHLRDYLS